MKSLLLLLFFIAVSSAQNCLSSADRLINKRCFTFVNQQLSYQDARDWCHFRNNVTFSYLATVPDANTANFLASIAHTLFNNNGGNFWIGLSRYNNKFQWDDGTPVSWTNFQLQNSQNYVAESITNAKWTTYPNDNKYNFICSYDPNGSQTGRPTYPPDSTTAPWVTTAETDTPPGPTPTVEPDSCTPLDQTTFLFAYSNDFDPSVIDQVLRNSYMGYTFSKLFTAFAAIRFDTKREEGFVYGTDFEKIASHIETHLPDSSLGFDSNNTGSDVLMMIDRFLNNTKVPVCGSKMIIYVKRYPNETEYSGIVTKMRQHHSYFTIFASTEPAGGYHPEILYDLASKTNGICTFDSDAHVKLARGCVETVFNPYLVYAENPQVSGNGRIQLSPLLVPYESSYWFTMTMQGNEPITAVRTIVLSWISGNNGDHLGEGGTFRSGCGFGNHFGNWERLNTTSYNVGLDYGYSDNKERTVQVRVHGYDHPIGYWVPCDD